MIFLTDAAQYREDKLKTKMEVSYAGENSRCDLQWSPAGKGVNFKVSTGQQRIFVSCVDEQYPFEKAAKNQRCQPQSSSSLSLGNLLKKL